MRDPGASLRRPFDAVQVKDRDLILKMLQAEDAMLLGGEVADMYRSEAYHALKTLTVEKAVQRVILRLFGFDTSPDSVATYRTVFRTYYRSPFDYDADVLKSVVYMRENRLLYYTSVPITMGDDVRDRLSTCAVTPCGGTESEDLLDAVQEMRCDTVFVGAFSGSWPPFLARKDRLLALEPRMRAASIGFVLVYIDEAHSTAWPVGLEDTPEPQDSHEERLARANRFTDAHHIGEAFCVVADGPLNLFAEVFRAWPDKYYRLRNMRVTAMSTYGKVADALVDEDCLNLIETMV